MQIVSDNSPADIARHHALEDLGFALRELTANLLRVTRGAGRSYEIGPQAQRVVELMIACREAAGSYPASWEIDRMLTVERDQEYLSRMSDDNLREIEAQQLMIKGALQIAASRLLKQSTQEAAGRREMFDGVNAHRDFLAEQRARWARESRSPKGPRKRRRKIPL